MRSMEEGWRVRRMRSMEEEEEEEKDEEDDCDNGAWRGERW